jgi:hypothetical protein
MLAAPFAPALDARGELDVQTRLVVRVAYFRPGHDTRLHCPSNSTPWILFVYYWFVVYCSGIRALRGDRATFRLREGKHKSQALKNFVLDIYFIWRVLYALIKF